MSKETTDQLNRSIIEFYDRLSAWENNVVRNKDYSLAQIHTLEVLGTYGSLRMKELAEKLGITTGTLTVQIDKLTKAELVERIPHESDRRSFLIKLTEAGHQLYREHDALHLELTKKISQSLTAAEAQTLVTCLKKMNADF